jgi:hypothetical protein
VVSQMCEGQATTRPVNCNSFFPALEGNCNTFREMIPVGWSHVGFLWCQSGTVPLTCTLLLAQLRGLKIYQLEKLCVALTTLHCEAGRLVTGVREQRQRSCDVPTARQDWCFKQTFNS